MRSSCTIISNWNGTGSITTERPFTEVKHREEAIADRESFLGAEGVVMGTRFMASQECPLHPRIKELLLQTGETDTMMVERSIKNAARVIKTDFAQKVLAMEERGATLEELFPMLDGQRVKRVYESGDTNDALIYCGQAVGLIDDIPTVKEIIDGIISQARLIVQRLNRMGISL